MTKLDISVVIPAKDEEESIPELSQWISRVMQEYGFSYEVIFVDDGSTDNTWGEIRKASLINSLLKELNSIATLVSLRPCTQPLKLRKVKW